MMLNSEMRQQAVLVGCVSVCLWLGACTDARPQSAVYVRFLSPPHGYTHGLEVHYPGATPITKEERLYIPTRKQQYHQFASSRQVTPTVDTQPPQYHYPRPNRVFNELGERFLARGYGSQYQIAESLFPAGLFQGPSSIAEFRKDHPGPVYDPFLLTGSAAENMVRMILGRGILYFHLVPHERLVIQTNIERLENNLIPHRLGSIRYGHPFFNYNK